MSAWTEVQGKVIIKKDSGLSIRDLITNSFNEVVIRYITQQESKFYKNIEVSFDFSFSEEGKDAYNQVGSFASAIKLADKDSSLDFTVLIPFIDRPR